MARGVLAVAEQAGIAGAGGGAARFLDLVVGGVGEAEDGLAEVLAEFAFSGQHLETGDFGGQRRIEDKIAVTDEDRSGYFAGHGRDEADRPGPQVEGGGIAMERQVADPDGLTAEREVAELLVGSVRVAARGGSVGGDEGKRQDEQCSQEKRNTTSEGRHSNSSGGSETVCMISRLPQRRLSKW